MTQKIDQLGYLAAELVKPLIRRALRILLRTAIEGTSKDRFDYARNRALNPIYVRLSIYGTCLWNPEVVARRTLIIFNRLERIANDRKK